MARRIGQRRESKNLRGAEKVVIEAQCAVCRKHVKFKATPLSRYDLESKEIQRPDSQRERLQELVCNFDSRRCFRPFTEQFKRSQGISSNKKLLETSASLVVTSALLVVTRSY